MSGSPDNLSSLDPWRVENFRWLAVVGAVVLALFDVSFHLGYWWSPGSSRGTFEPTVDGGLLLYLPAAFNVLAAGHIKERYWQVCIAMTFVGIAMYSIDFIYLFFS